MAQEKETKRKALMDLGLDPYPVSFKRSLTTLDITEGKIKEGKEGTLAGRLMRMRSMGQAAFFNIQDLKGLCQCYVKAGDLPKKDQDFFKNTDLGDIVGVKGSLFKTKKGERTLRVSSFQILCKSTEFLPEKYHGLEDKELRYRRRHLDLITNKKTFETLLMKSEMISLIREFLRKKNFFEIETPILQPIYGGAAAFPFKTKHRALDAAFYLRISPELYLKRAIAGGLDKVFEIGKNFRNEGLDRLHNPEFTMLEYYETYTDYEDQMKQVEELICFLAKTLKKTLKFSYREKPLDLTPPWPRLSVMEAIQKWGKIDLSNLKKDEMIQKLKSKNIPVDEKNSEGQIIMQAFDYLSEGRLWNPIFIKDFPKDISPLTKDHRSQKNTVERFEPYIAGMEIGNAYTELNDPIEQKQRFKDQQKILNTEERHPMDEDFLHAVGVGMPPLGGVGIGLDRLAMILTNQNQIREVIWFPTIKPRT